MADSAVAWTELQGSPVESYAEGDVRAQRMLKCPWVDRYILRDELLGNNAEFGGVSWVQYPDFDSLRVQGVRIEPFHDDIQPKTQADLEADLGSYCEFAKLTVTYGLMPTIPRPDLPTPEDGTFLTYRQDFGGEFLEVDRGSLKWLGAPEQPVNKEAKPTIYVPIIEHHITWHRVINPPWQYIREAIGCVNAGNFMGGEEGTILFAGCQADKDFTYLEQLENPEFGWKISYLFREKVFTNFVQEKDAGGVPGVTLGWNHAPRTKPAGTFEWDILVATDLDKWTYWAIEFDPLFQFAAVA